MGTVCVSMLGVAELMARMSCSARHEDPDEDDGGGGGGGGGVGESYTRGSRFLGGGGTGKASTAR